MIAKLPILAGSAAVIVVMVTVALALGFRARARLDEAALARLAEAEGASVQAAIIAPDAKSALARLSGDKVMIARVMGGDVSARVAPLSAVRATLKRARLSVRFADLGFPPLHLRVQEPPSWLAELVSGEVR